MFFVFHGDECIRVEWLRMTTSGRSEEQDAFPIWHCQKSDTISNEIHRNIFVVWPHNGRRECWLFQFWVRIKFITSGRHQEMSCELFCRSMWQMSHPMRLDSYLDRLSHDATGQQLARGVMCYSICDTSAIATRSMILSSTSSLLFKLGDCNSLAYAKHQVGGWHSYIKLWSPSMSGIILDGRLYDFWARTRSQHHALSTQIDPRNV